MSPGKLCSTLFFSFTIFVVVCQQANFKRLADSTLLEVQKCLGEDPLHMYTPWEELCALFRCATANAVTHCVSYNITYVQLILGRVCVDLFLLVIYM